MKSAFLFALLLGLDAHVALAADKPVNGPVPDWVRPVNIPADQANADANPVRILLSDQQIKLEPGKQTVYSDVALKIQTPQGLAAGNLSFPWRAETDTLTIHKILIRRGDKIIDALSSGQTFTVARRETNMEAATLDGVLTANIQPEGLQVGDILEFVASITSSDPTMKDHVEQLAADWNGVPITHAHLRMDWPSSLPIRLRKTDALPTLKPQKNGNLTSLEISLYNLQPVLPPKGAPARYQTGRLIEASDFSSWADLTALMAPLYQKASAISPSGPLQDEISRIRSASSDPKKRTEAALALVQDRVRYVALLMGAGGYVPADAEATWFRRYGDCKGKTALLLGILHSLGVEAEPVAVSSNLGDGFDQRLPMVALFDHVIVRAKVAGNVYWLDGTRVGDTSLDRLQIPNFGWGLPLFAKGAQLVDIRPSPLDQPDSIVSIEIDATDGITLPAPTKAEAVFRGDDATTVRLSLANLTNEARDRALREYWKNRYDFIDIKSVSAKFDDQTGEQHLTMQGDAKMDWDDGYQMDDATVGYKADFSRDPGPNHDAPFAVSFPFYTKNSETILLPPDFPGIKFSDEVQVDETLAGIAYKRQVSISGNALTMEKSIRSLTSEFPYAASIQAQARLRELSDTGVNVPKPPRYQPTERELSEGKLATPQTAQAWRERAELLMKHHQMEDGLKAYAKALEIDPKDIRTLSSRAIAYLSDNKLAEAKKDLDAADAISPGNPETAIIRAMVEAESGNSERSIAYLTAALTFQPKNPMLLRYRAKAYYASNQFDNALIDAGAAIAVSPGDVDMYLLRANAFRQAGKNAEALAEADALTKANPDNSFAQVAAARIYSTYHKDADVFKAYDRAIAIKPEAYVYFNRSQSRPRKDREDRLADVNKALALDPKFVPAIIEKSKLQKDLGDKEGEIDTLSQAIVSEAAAPQLLNQRGIAYAQLGKTALAQKDFAAARASAESAADLNALCWEKATANIALDSAIDDCDAALAKSPKSWPIMDSRAFVLLRLGRLDDAIAQYTTVLNVNPNLSASLYGRAIAWARKGDKAQAEKDADAARKQDPDVDSRFESYGIKHDVSCLSPSGKP